ncbi:ABC-three component system protein [Bacillus thuringiensis]|uniref:ABC-three component systems C-terminal domain-containing protein n=1 Tax=Bacillus thuringiensis TaxID=1428 RepID=A0A9X7GC02_BACTU|nr:ABC-three component system protein [Bacillus thuringiensis]PFV28045.1 hypothetical protein COK99_22015 [Bacillus thuringiensis]
MAKNNKDQLEDIIAPEITKKLTNLDLLYGKPMPPITRLESISDSEFEDFVREWASGYLEKEYEKVRRSSGSGDMGRDVVAYVSYTQDDNEIWDNYQCKQYNSPLTPKTAILEVGKLCYYTFNKEFTVPRHYYFVCPKGTGPQLSKLIDRPKNFKKKLIADWDKTCKTQITTRKDVLLEGDFLDYVNNFDFNIIQDIDPQKLIEQHSTTKYYYYRFGGMIPSRPESFEPPEDIRDNEVVYVKKLLEAYSDYNKEVITNIEHLAEFSLQFDHFNRQRNCFYEAESLMLFERDILPNNIQAFEGLKKEVYDGIIDEVQSHHADGFTKIKEVCKIARTLNIYNYPLKPNLRGNDLTGICHHLANENKVSWV